MGIHQSNMDQETLDDIADTLGVKYQVLDNLTHGKKIYCARMVLTNNSKHEIRYGKWEIYFCHIRMIEPGKLPHPHGFEMEKYGIKIDHINGCLFKLSPLKSFKTLETGNSLEINFRAQYYSVARSDLMPNWYILGNKLKPRLIKSTVGEDISFVQPFDKPEAWKRFDYELESGNTRYDHYNPYSLKERFDRNQCPEEGVAHKHVIPTPVHIQLPEGDGVSLAEGTWSISHTIELHNEAKYLSGKINIEISDNETGSTDHSIILELGEIKNVSKYTSSDADQSVSQEAYSVVVSRDCIRITGVGRPGVFHGIQTLLSLCVDRTVPLCEVTDWPRYPYRGMHLDVSRNFHSKQQVLKLLDVMAMYKMNRFHFHLTDDEGWRLEIPGLEELTTVGARRGHLNSNDTACLLPLLGSGCNFDTSGSGHYTVEAYREILQYANDRHIEVIPEIDMPGHSHAAIMSMKVRYNKYKDKKDTKKATEYILHDLDDLAAFRSVQMFSDNAMNPGLESTYTFITKVVTEVIKMHKDIQPLRTFHFGGDEVPYESWEGSPACMSLTDSGKVKSFQHLMEYFVTRVADIVAKRDLNLGAWQDGVVTDEIKLQPVKRSKFKNKEVLAYAWHNVWESGLSGCAYRLANAGYKVIMCQGTHLYFDHPYEPDPEERGLYWACRFIDSQKAFMMMPDNIYANADYKLTGERLPKDFFRKRKDDHDDLKKPENVIGIQGQLWTELVRTAEQMDFMIYPRLLCVAERGWHKAAWETMADKTKLRDGQTLDWACFAHTLGHKELARLDALDVAYRIPPPGAQCSDEDGKLDLNCAYAGLPLYYSTDAGATWTPYTGRTHLLLDADLHLCSRVHKELHKQYWELNEGLEDNSTVFVKCSHRKHELESADGKRQSRVVVMKRRDDMEDGKASVET